jgi:hypothetical protein
LVLRLVIVIVGATGRVNVPWVVLDAVSEPSRAV